MAQSTFSIRMDEDLKKDFDGLCNDFGMTMTTAFIIFAKAVVREKKIPFEICASQQAKSNELLSEFKSLREKCKSSPCSDIPLDEINSEINAARRETQG